MYIKINYYLIIINSVIICIAVIIFIIKLYIESDNVDDRNVLEPVSPVLVEHSQ